MKERVLFGREEICNLGRRWWVESIYREFIGGKWKEGNGGLKGSGGTVSFEFDGW